MVWTFLLKVPILDILSSVKPICFGLFQQLHFYSSSHRYLDNHDLKMRIPAHLDVLMQLCPTFVLDCLQVSLASFVRLLLHQSSLVQSSHHYAKLQKTTPPTNLSYATLQHFCYSLICHMLLSQLGICPALHVDPIWKHLGVAHVLICDTVL